MSDERSAMLLAEALDRLLIRGGSIEPNPGDATLALHPNLAPDLALVQRLLNVRVWPEPPRQTAWLQGGTHASALPAEAAVIKGVPAWSRRSRGPRATADNSEILSPMDQPRRRGLGFGLALVMAAAALFGISLIHPIRRYLQRAPDFVPSPDGGPSIPVVPAIQTLPARSSTTPPPAADATPPPNPMMQPHVATRWPAVQASKVAPQARPLASADTAQGPTSTVLIVAETREAEQWTSEPAATITQGPTQEATPVPSTRATLAPPAASPTRTRRPSPTVGPPTRTPGPSATIFPLPPWPLTPTPYLSPTSPPTATYPPSPGPPTQAAVVTATPPEAQPTVAASATFSRLARSSLPPLQGDRPRSDRRPSHFDRP